MECDIELDKSLLCHLLALFLFRGCTIAGYYFMFMDAFMSGFSRYIQIEKKYIRGGFGNVTTKSNSKDLYCNFKKLWKKSELTTMFGVYKMTTSIFVGFLGFLAVVFVIQIVVNIRCLLFPIPEKLDKKGLPIISRWTWLQTWTYRMSTLLGDLPGVATAVALYAMIRGKNGIGCFECQITPTCINKVTFEELIFPSEMALRILYPSTIVLVFYKSFYTYYIWSNPMLCECYCKPLRCCTGTFLSTIVTMLMMTPGWMVLNNYYYTKAGIKKDIVSALTENLMLMGVIIWAVIGFLALCIPVKNYLLAEKKDEKKK
eukprot:gene6171-6882_t